MGAAMSTVSRSTWRRRGFSVEDRVEEVLPADCSSHNHPASPQHTPRSSPHNDPASPPHTPVPSLGRGHSSIQDHLQPLHSDSLESLGAMQAVPFVGPVEPLHAPASRGRLSRSRRRHAHLLAEKLSSLGQKPQKMFYGSFEYSSCSDSYANTTSESDSSDDHLPAPPVPEVVEEEASLAPHRRRRWSEGVVVDLYPVGTQDEDGESSSDEEEEEFVNRYLDDVKIMHKRSEEESDDEGDGPDNYYLGSYSRLLRERGRRRPWTLTLPSPSEDSFQCVSGAFPQDDFIQEFVDYDAALARSLSRMDYVADAED